MRYDHFRPAARSTLMALLLTIASTGALRAQETQTQSDPATATLTFPASQTSVAQTRTDSRTETFSVPQFDPALGTLLSVRVRHTTNAATTATLSQEIANGFYQTANATLTVATSVTVPGGSQLDATASRSGSMSVPGNGSVQLTMPTVPANSDNDTLTGAAMAGYVGTGTVPFTMSQDFVQSVAGNTGFHYQFQGTATSTVHVTYVYISAAGASTWNESGNESASYGLPVSLAPSVQSRSDTQLETISLPKFDPANGTLTSVELHFAGNAGASCFYVPQTFLFGTYYANVSMNFTFELQLPGSQNLTQSASRLRTIPFVNSPGTAGLPGWGYTSPTRTITGSALSNYIGTGNLDLTLSQVFDQGFTTGRPVNWNFNASSNTTVYATYHYYNGVPATQVVRQGSPANALQLLPSPTRPIIGTTWEPYIDHSTLATNALLDVAMFGASQANTPFPGLGTILIDQVFASYLIAQPNESFALAIANDPALVGLQVSVQGVSISVGYDYTLTNAIDITIGEW